MIKKERKGVSPVITTVLLVLIVLVLATLIIVWGTQFIPEKLSKFGASIEDGCSNVKLTATPSGEGANMMLALANTGDIHIYKIGVQTIGGSSSEIKTYDLGPNNNGLKPGDTFSINVNAGSADKLEIVPIILGETEGKTIQEFSCSGNSKVISL